MKLKKCLLFTLVGVLLLSLTACATGSKNDDSASENSSDTTLMIYMIGSDLEAKGGAGTDDMEEILESQVDLSCNNVLVYAGGTKKWHNDTLEADEGHTILQLTADGFQSVETRSEVSMGDAETLSYFLNYGHQNYKTAQYALILWDHGNGPLIGYGKDMLHENDSLTLLEMQEALAASPFTGDNKLAWVGFDACLMSSVELACVWQEYAEYLIASQEIEPAFGWNYGFLSHLGSLDTVNLADEITQQYLSSCLEYYERRDFDQRDTTLACMDLSKLDPLKAALSDLFTKAEASLDDTYNELAATRVDTRALGRASTGSEYDLIDLVDMAEKMKQHYPDEAEAVKKAAEAMIVHNVTNTEGCCGLSLYYPFYNKSYFKKAWGDVYSELNVLPAYTDYLETYAEQWLENDLSQTVASSTKPQAVTDSKFSLSLTEDQAATYVDSSYYILQQKGNAIYTSIYSSSNVVKKGNTLTANFNGNIIYAKNKFDQYWIPAIDEHDTVGDYTRYSTYVNLTNSLPLAADRPEDYEHKVQGHRFHISVNNTTDQIRTAALVPYTTQVQTENLVGGKLEDADLSQWTQYYFLQERHIYLQRDENGTILPIDQWKKSDFLSANVSPVGDGVEFVMAPIPAGEYYLVFEVEDSHGNRYCSELLPIQSKGVSLPVDFYEEPAEVTWDSGEKVELFSQSGITAYLTTVEQYDSISYALQIKNDNDFDVEILGHELIYNETIYCPDGTFGYFFVPAGETAADRLNFGNAQHMEMLQDLKSLQFVMSVTTAKGDATLIHHKAVSVELSDFAAGLRQDPPEDSWYASTYYQTDIPSYGLYAKQQTLFEYAGVRATLLGMGTAEDRDHLVFRFCFENISSDTANFAISGLTFDDVFINYSTGPITIPAGMKIYKCCIVQADELTRSQITSASAVNVWVSHMQFATLLGGGGFSEVQTYPITLSSRGAKATIQQGSTLLYENDSVEIFLERSAERTYGGYEWICTMINKGNTDLFLLSSNETLNGKADDDILTDYPLRCPADQSTVFTVTYTGNKTGSLRLQWTPVFYDFTGETLLYSGTSITLETK